MGSLRSKASAFGCLRPQGPVPSVLGVKAGLWQTVEEPGVKEPSLPVCPAPLARLVSGPRPLQDVKMPVARGSFSVSGSGLSVLLSLLTLPAHGSSSFIHISSHQQTFIEHLCCTSLASSVCRNHPLVILPGTPDPAELKLATASPLNRFLLLPPSPIPPHPSHPHILLSRASPPCVTPPRTSVILWVHIPAPPLPTCVTLTVSFLQRLSHPCLQNGHHQVHLTRLERGLLKNVGTK